MYLELKYIFFVRQIGTILRSTGTRCVVRIPNEEVSVPGMWLEPVLPKKDDGIKMMLGPERGTEGILLDIKEENVACVCLFSVLPYWAEYPISFVGKRPDGP